MHLTLKQFVCQSYRYKSILLPINRLLLPNSLSDILASQSGRIRWVAELLYPGGRWRVHIARDLSIGRSTLYRYLTRRRPAQGIDDNLIMLMARERIASHSRGREIAQAEKAFARALGRPVPTSAKDSK